VLQELLKGLDYGSDCHAWNPESMEGPMAQRTCCPFLSPLSFSLCLSFFLARSLGDAQVASVSTRRTYLWGRDCGEKHTNTESGIYRIPLSSRIYSASSVAAHRLLLMTLDNLLSRNINWRAQFDEAKVPEPQTPVQAWHAARLASQRLALLSPNLPHPQPSRRISSK
jgi:hypothetical protein